MDRINPSILDADSQETLRQRSIVGHRCIASAADAPSPVAEDDRETYASDAVSDILTALFGPAGCYVQKNNEHWKLEAVENAQRDAQLFLNRCINSWIGDAEDYTVSES